MFSANVKDPKWFKNCITAIASLKDEVAIDVTPEGITARTMDIAQIALIDLRIPASAFEDYKIGDPLLNIGIDFSELQKILTRLHPNDTVEFSIDTKVKIKLKGETTRNFSSAIIDTNTTPPKEPKITFTSYAEVFAVDLKEALKDAELISNHIIVEFTADKKFIIRGMGDTGNVDIDLTEALESITLEETAKATFALDVLANMTKPAESNTIIKLSLKNNTPVKLEYQMGEADVKYYLAPRIEAV
jgi:proliferating cell nuclear antigen